MVDVMNELGSIKEILHKTQNENRDLNTKLSALEKETKVLTQVLGGRESVELFLSLRPIEILRLQGHLEVLIVDLKEEKVRELRRAKKTVK